MPASFNLGFCFHKDVGAAGRFFPRRTRRVEADRGSRLQDIRLRRIVCRYLQQLDRLVADAFPPVLDTTRRHHTLLRTEFTKDAVLAAEPDATFEDHPERIDAFMPVKLRFAALTRLEDLHHSLNDVGASE